MFHNIGCVNATDQEGESVTIERPDVEQLILEAALLTEDTHVFRMHALVHLEAFELAENQGAQQAAKPDYYVFELLHL